MRFMSDFREAMWGAVQSTISELDFDFADYCDEALRPHARGRRRRPRWSELLEEAGGAAG